MALQDDGRSDEIIDWADDSLKEEEWQSNSMTQSLYKTIKRIVDQKKKAHEEAKISENASMDDPSLEETLQQAANKNDTETFITVSCLLYKLFDNLSKWTFQEFVTALETKSKEDEATSWADENLSEGWETKFSFMNERLHEELTYLSEKKKDEKEAWEWEVDLTTTVLKTPLKQPSQLPNIPKVTNKN